MGLRGELMQCQCETSTMAQPCKHGGPKAIRTQSGREKIGSVDVREEASWVI